MAIRKSTIQKQVLQKIGEIAPPGEQVSVFFEAITGPSPWMSELPFMSWVMLFITKVYYVALTNTSVVIVGGNKFTNRPTGLIAAEPYTTAHFSNMNIVPLWSKVYYQLPGQTKPTRLNVHRRWRKELDMLVSYLGQAQNQLGGGYVPQQQQQQQQYPQG